MAWQPLSLLQVLVRRGAAIVCTIAPRSPAVKATGKQRRLRYHRRAVKATMGTAPERVETLVVGGGIGGLATALALSRQGMPVCVLEQAHEFGEIGAGIQLAPNALRMLERLGVVERIAADAVYPRRAVLMSAVTGERLTGLDFGPRFRETYGYPYIVMHRSDRKVHGLGQGAEEVVVACADGSTYRARAVVGADGVWSTVRRFTVGD